MKAKIFIHRQNQQHHCQSNHHKTRRHQLPQAIHWHFHPPLGFHHGGHYERLIRSVRGVLSGITIEQEMSKDNLLTFLCEAERILNDRPLTLISDDATKPYSSIAWQFMLFIVW